ncbi:MAG: hypothetical protein R3Y67_09325 [Eubacteriales bacterium]
MRFEESRSIKSTRPLSKDTAYMIGSITKSGKLMTTLMEEEEINVFETKAYYILMSVFVTRF